MRKWRYVSATDLDQTMAERLRNFPREPDMLVYALRSLVALLIRAALRVYHRFEIIGAEHLPREGSFVLVANHASHLDTVCLLAAVPFGRLHRAFPAAAADYFFKSVPRTWVASIVVNALPFARGAQVRQSLNICAELLANPGNVLIIFPEGTRSRNGAVQQFKAGIGALVAGRDVNVLPCYLAGAGRVWPKGQSLPRPGKVRLIIGPPRNFAARIADKAGISAIASELRTAVIQLGQTHELHPSHDEKLRRGGAVLPLVDSGNAEG
ncbi:MAG TPA: lysophospholipid acyltransferase family protein [Chthoniobacterales bacterium]|nr:lysophospholipid acyltransferase family protein [Chthoniobacterales bacterium]